MQPAFVDSSGPSSAPAVISPLDEHMGLDIARSLGRRGVSVYGMDADPRAPGGKSKYVRLVRCPDPHRNEEKFVDFLVAWGKESRGKAVLFPVSDEVALLCSRERERLSPYYAFVMPGHETLVSLSTKAGLGRVAEAIGVPAPKTFFLNDEQSLAEVARQVEYPVLLKPVESHFWHRPEIAAQLLGQFVDGRAKVAVCSDPSSLARTYRGIARYDARMVVQELIPGPDENLTYISFYLNRDSEPLAFFAGRKLRVIPLGFGSASYVRSFHDPGLVDVALRLLRGAQYQGLGGLEFKKDSRDGRYKLIEFNTRFGMWDGLGVRCGVDTPYIAYCDALGRRSEPAFNYREGVIWWDWQRDVRAFWMLRKRKQLTLKEWLGSLRGERMWAIYSLDDWLPGLAFTWSLVRILSGRAWSRLRQLTANVLKHSI